MKHVILKIALIVSLAGISPFLWTGVQAEDFNRSSLPIPDRPFKGKIGLRPSDSVKDFPKEITAPQGAPNVFLILTDDVGFGASSTFGGPIPTPTFDDASAPSRHTTQHIEMFANRAIYSDGWVAATTHPIPPWVSVADAVDPIEGYDWELYNITEAKLTEDNFRDIVTVA